MKELNILVAEDYPDDVFLLRQAFQKADLAHRLQVVSNGMEVLEYLKGENAYSDRSQHPFPDVLLLDLNMPRMNGFEVLEWLRQDARYSGLVVHVLTASAREADVRRAYELRVNSYIMKPSRMNELVAFVKALDQWHQFVCLPSKPLSPKPVPQERVSF